MMSKSGEMMSKPGEMMSKKASCVAAASNDNGWALREPGGQRELRSRILQRNSLTWPPMGMSRNELERRESYTLERVIRRRGWVEVLACVHDGTPCVLFETMTGAPPAARAMLEAMAEQQRVPHHPQIPAVMATGERDGRFFVALACDAVADLEQVVADHSSDGDKISYAVAIAFVDALHAAVAAAHAHGQMVGALCWANILIGPSGQPWFVGFGHNPLVPASGGMSHRCPGLCEPPERALGAEPTVAADVYVLHAFLRRLAVFVDLPEGLLEALQGKPSGLTEALTVQTRSLALDPSQRPQSVAELNALYSDVRQQLDVTADPEVLSRFVREYVARFDKSTLVILDGGDVVELPTGKRVDLKTRGNLRRILLSLVKAHGGQPRSVQELFAAGWPEQRAQDEAARSRVYVALSSLRKLGLKPYIKRVDDGYLLDQSLSLVQRASSR